MKLDQLAFIRDLVIKKGLVKYNANVIPIKARSAIKILNLNNYNETNFCKYKYLIKKLIYLVCKIRPDIDFTIAQLRKYNTNLKKSYLRAAKRVVRYLKRTMQIKLIYR